MRLLGVPFRISRVVRSKPPSTLNPTTLDLQRRKHDRGLMILLGFLLDGGVHYAAMIRHVLPSYARPTRIVSSAALHRAHLPPHDTILGLAFPASDSTSPAHGSKTALSTIHKDSDIPGGIGQSTPTGQILISVGLPDTDSNTRPPLALTITTLNAVIQVVLNYKNLQWVLKINPANGSEVEAREEAGKIAGVENELTDFVLAVKATEEGKELSEKELAGYPTGTLWDVGLIQALLTSQGQPVELGDL